VLQVLLQAVAALIAADGRDGRLVHDHGAVVVVVVVVVVVRSHGAYKSVV
jgi:hypothetical protein